MCAKAPKKAAAKKGAKEASAVPTPRASTPRRGLGRGLEALLAPVGLGPAANAKAPDSHLQTLPLARIRPADYQPRQHFDPQALQELAGSIREKGVLQPMLVRPKGDAFEIVAGERRYRASKLAGLSEVPVIIRDLADREALEIAIIENLQRADLSPLEEARAYQALIDQGHTQESVAQVVGKGRSTVSNTLRLLGLPSAALRALEEGRITAGHARAILSLPELRRGAALERILARDLSVREAEALAKELLADGPGARPRAGSARPWREAETRLSSALGTPVRIQGQERGTVALSYRSPEELQRLLERLQGE